jgi:hypothetical protein
MSNVGKKLKEERASDFESTEPEKPFKSRFPSGPSAPINGVADFGGLIGESIKQDAGRSSSQDGMMTDPYGADFFNSKILGFDLGEVTDTHKDEKGFVDVYNPHMDMEALRAEHQSAVTKIGATGIQFVGKTAVGVVGNILGTVYGLGGMAKDKINGEEVDATEIFDNDLTRSLDDASEAIDANNTLFVNPKDGIGFNFNTLKAINDAYSFIASAAVSEMFMQTVGNVAGGMGAATTGLRLLRYGQKFNKILKMLEKTDDVEKLGRRLGMTVEEMSKLKRIKDSTQALAGFARKTLTNTGYEAGLEARGVKDEMIASMTNEMEYYIKSKGMSPEEADAYRAEKTKAIEHAAEVGSLTTFSLNSALLGASNAMQFPTIFGSSFKKSSNLGDLVRTGLGEIGKKKGKLAQAKRAMGVAGRVLKNPATEFTEETLQGLFGNFSKNQFEVMMGGETQTGLLTDRARSITDNIQKSLEETYGTDEGLHEGLIGAIVGAIGIPGKKRSADGGKKKWTVHGGIAESVRDEMQRRKDEDEAIAAAKSISPSEVLNYNKDNAIRATMDGQKEDLAAAAKNKVEFEAVQDNKVFRYTMDRVEKGMENFIEEDIQELQEMATNDIDGYRKMFGKDEHFTKEDAIAEVDNFAKKAEIYKNAYKKVHKRYNLNLIRGDKYTKTLSDALTFAVASEKLYNERLDVLHQRVFDLTNGKFSKEEIEKFTNTSLKVEKASKPKRDYINNKNTKRVIEHFNDPKYLRLRKEINEAEAEAIKDLEEGSEEYNAVRKKYKGEMATLYRDHSKRLKKFQHKKSSTVREMQKSIDEIVDEVNADIEARASESMKQISRPEPKLTREELIQYMTQKESIYNELNKAFNSKAIYDRSELENEDGQELLKELNEISDRLMTSTNVAAYLYGFKNNPSEMYNKVVAAKFWENMDNAARMDRFLDMLMENGDDGDEFKEMFAEYQTMIAALEADLPDLQKHYKDKDFDRIRTKFLELKARITKYNGFLGVKQAVDKQNKTAKDKAKTEEEIAKNKDMKDNEESEKEDNPEDPKDPNPKEDDDGSDPDDLFGGVTVNKNKKKDPKPAEDPKQASKEEDESEEPNTPVKKNHLKGVKRDFNNNSFLIREEWNAFKEHHPAFPALFSNKDGKGFKDKAATTLRLLDDQLFPANNEGLAKKLKDDGISVETYVKGLVEVQDNPDVLRTSKLEELSNPVYTFLRYAPMQLDIYDKQLSAKDKYDFEITQDDKSVHSQYMFAAKDMRKETEQERIARAKYDEEIAKAEAKLERKLEENKGSVHDTKTRIEAEFKAEKNKLYHKYKASGKSEHTNLNFRLLLLRNHFIKGDNLLKLKVQNVDLGNLEKANYLEPGPDVDEFNVDQLGFTADNFSIDDMYYGDRSGRYIRIDGEKTTEMKEHPFKNITTAQNGKVFFKYKNVNGKSVPIKMNTSRLGSKHTAMINKVLDAYFNHQSPVDFTTKNTGVKFLDGLSIDEFLSFFMHKRGGGRTLNKIFVRNSYYVYEPTAENDYKARVVFYTGDTIATDINSKEELEENRKDLTKGLMENRFVVNSQFIVKDGEINKDVVKYMFDNKVINHSFNTKSNFDKIYAPGYNKGLKISLADTVDTETNKRYKKPTYDKQFVKLKNDLAGKGKYDKLKYEPNLVTFNSALLNDVLNKARKSANDYINDGKELTNDIKDKLISEAIERATDKKLKMIHKFLRNGNAHRYDPTGEHETDFKIREGDTDIDKLLRIFNFLKADVYKNTSFKNRLSREMESWGAKNEFYSQFRKAKPHSSVKINSYDKKSAGEFKSNITTEKQFNAMKKMAYLLKSVTDPKGAPHIHIDYSEDYAGAFTIKNGKEQSRNPTHWSYMAQTGLNSKNHKKGHYKTRLKSVTVKGEPQFVDGKIVGGSIFFNVQTLKDTGKVDSQGNKIKKPSIDQIIFMADSEAPLPKQNIITSMYFPFMDSNFNISEEFDKALELIEERRLIRQATEQNFLNKKNLDKLALTGKEIGLDGSKARKAVDVDFAAYGVTDADIEAANSKDEDDADEDDDDYDDVEGRQKSTVSIVNDMLTAAGATEKKTIGVAPVIQDNSYYSGAAVKSVISSLTLRRLNTFLSEGGTLNEKAKELALNYYKKQHIDTPDKLVRIIEDYALDGVNHDDLVKFAEYLYDAKVDDCSNAPF